MTKRILSLVLSVALLLSCVSGITLFTAARTNELPTPFIWMEIDENGNVTASRELQNSGIDPYIPTKISDEEGYGLKLQNPESLASDWQGFWIGSDALYGSDVESVTMLVEYYIDSSVKTGDQLLRIMPASVYDANGVKQAGEQWIDYFTNGKPDDGKGNNVLLLDQTAVLAYTYPAAQLDAIRNEGMAIGFKGCAGSNGGTYIKSLKFVETKYVNTDDRGCAYINFVPQAELLSDYYPNFVKTTDSKNLSTFPEGTTYTHFKVQGKALASDSTKNKPVYIKMTAKEGYENTSITFNQFEAYTPNPQHDRWACDNGYAHPVIDFTNGVGGVMLPETSFTNGNNGSSFRLMTEDVSKIASVEVYDVTTYCNEAAATAELKELFHEYKMGREYGVTTKIGATGTKITCDACDEVLLENTSTLPRPYVTLDTKGGVLNTNFAVTAQGDQGSITPTLIPGTDEYGIRLNYDWSGFSLDGKLLENVPQGQSVTMVVEYYIDFDFTTERWQLFRYQSYSGMALKDVFTDTDRLLSKRNGLFLHTFTAEEMAAIANGSMSFQILGASVDFAGKVYIKSMKLVNTEYVHPITDNGYAYMDFNGRVVCDYYEDLIHPDAYNMNSAVLEVTPDFAGYTYINVFGPAAGGDDNKNKPVYVKLFATKGNGTATLPEVKYDQSNAEGNWTWGAMPEITFVDGQATLLLNACLKNRLHSEGSFRIPMNQIEKLARIEVYDVATYCAHANATVEMEEELHAAMLANALNTKKVGAKEATTTENGYTGDTVCITCDTVLKYGVVIPKQNDSGLPTPYAQFGTEGGVLSALGADILPAGEGVTSVVVEAIGATGEAGIKLTGDWKGIQMNGVSLATMAQGKKAALVIEYYVDADLTGNEQMFRYRIAGGKQVDIFGGALVSKQSGLICHVFTDAELAAIGNSDFAIDILGCAGGTDIVYLQSAKVISTEYLHVDTDGGYVYTTFEKDTLCDYYPDVEAPNANGVTYADLESDPQNYPDTDWLYRYFTLQGGPLANSPTASKPVYIKFYTTDEYKNTTVAIQGYEVTNGTNAGIFSGDAGYAAAVAEIVNGVGGVLLPKACFTNGLNRVGSFRIFYTEAVKIARVEVYDVVTYCALDDADQTLVEEFHKCMNDNRVNIKIVGKVDATTEAPGYSGDVYCATCDTKLAAGRVLPQLAESNLPDPYAWLLTTNGNYSVKGTAPVITGGAGSLEVLPIGATGEYGIRLQADWSGFLLNGAFNDVPEGKDVIMAVEYYIDSDATGQMLRYQIGGVIGDASHVDIMTSSKECHTPTLLLIPISAEQVAEAKANPDYLIAIMGCPPGANVTYIQSVRVIDPQYVKGSGDVGYDFISFEDEAVCDYYPDILGQQANGITINKTEEGKDEDGDTIRFGYIAVTQSLLKEGEANCPVVIRLTFKEGSNISGFGWQYQCKAEPQADHSEFFQAYSNVADGVVEVLIDEAAFTNKLNTLGSFRVPNSVKQPVLDNLLEIRVMRVNDNSALKAYIKSADELLEGKTYASQAAFTAALANAQEIVDDLWSTEKDIADALAALEAAEAMLVDCDHSIGVTEIEGYVKETCLTDGYEGDTVCVDCGFVLIEGKVIPHHTLTKKNAKEATCDAVGHTADLYCEVCKEIAQYGEDIPALPHTWDDGVVTKPATPTETGEITLTCAVCKSKKVVRCDFEAAMADVNEDGRIDSTDARLVLQFAVKKIAPSELNLETADVDGNGKIDSTDARLILQFAVGKIKEFPQAK